MKRGLTFAGILLLSCLIYARTNTKATQSGFEMATVVSVHRYVSPSNYVGDNPSDAPLQAESYNYDIGVRLNCDTYVGRYESAIDYLPAVFAPNHTVDVRLDKHLIYVSLPQGDRIVKMGIVYHKHLKVNACRVSG